jgi:hypothetical protein
LPLGLQMKTKIDELSTHYLIPGVELAPTAVADPEMGEADYTDAPYSQMPAMADVPSPTGWQDLLGLNQVSPSPSQIDPPPRPTSLEKGATTNAPGAPLLLPGSAPGDGMGAASATPKFDRMIGMLAVYEQAARRIRARAAEGGGR